MNIFERLNIVDRRIADIKVRVVHLSNPTPIKEIIADKKDDNKTNDE